MLDIKRAITLWIGYDIETSKLKTNAYNQMTPMITRLKHRHFDPLRVHIVKCN